MEKNWEGKHIIGKRKGVENEVVIGFVEIVTENLVTAKVIFSNATGVYYGTYYKPIPLPRDIFDHYVLLENYLEYTDG